MTEIKTNTQVICCSVEYFRTFVFAKFVLLHNIEGVGIQPKKRSVDVPIYAIDLNVFFDVIKDRARSEDAGTIFKAAFGHQIRLTATEEFVSELRRNSRNEMEDPVLAIAKQIPNLPVQPKSVIEMLFPVVSETIFPKTQQPLSGTDESDILHICHAIASGAAGYITSDKKILLARDSLMAKFSLDIIAPSEFVELLDLPLASARDSVKATNSFHISSSSVSDIPAFLKTENIDTEIDFLEASVQSCERICVSDAEGIIGLAILSRAAAVDRSSRLMVCVRQEHAYSSTIVDFLISETIRLSTEKGGCTISLLDIPSHPVTRRIALSHGFQQNTADEQSLSKIALGRPVTKETWTTARLTIERLSGLKLQEKCPKYDTPVVEAVSVKGRKLVLQLFELETLLSPTLFALPRRRAAIVPITGDFANALLGTQEQLSFLEVPEAQFLSRRTYYNTTRAANVMIRGNAIAFYESVRGKGRGAVVALARIVDVTTISKENVPEFVQRGAVIDDLGQITKAGRVLATTFDNLMPFKRPVTLQTLRQIGCVPASNFISATSISTTHLEKIVLAGFADA